jgi:hypothetical protein
MSMLWKAFKEIMFAFHSCVKKTNSALKYWELAASIANTLLTNHAPWIPK